MYLIFFNLAVVSALVFYITRTVKRSFQYEVQQLYSFLRGSSKLPPGPLGLPFLGSIPSVTGMDGYTPFSQIATAYGGMAYFRLGKKKVLVLREPDMIKEAYKLAAFSDRPKTSFKDDGLIGNKGIIQSVGNVWSEHRRLILSAFRTMGLKSASASSSSSSLAAASSVSPATQHIAEKMQHDVQEYLTFVAGPGGATSDMALLERLTGRLAGSCVSSCVLGLPKSFADPEFVENVEVIEEGFHVGEKLAPFEVLPILKMVPGLWRRVQEKMKRNHCVTCRYFKGLIREKVTETAADQSGGSGDGGSGEACQGSPDSLITIYRREMTKREALETKILSEIQLMQTITDLFCAGTETIKYSLMWMMLYMAKYPEIQQKIQDEIESVIGDEDRLVSWNDLSLLPYTEATILECLRLRPVLPFGHPRAVHDGGAEFRGYEVPKGTVVLALIWDVHQDPRYWENPQQFRPSRFLNAEGKTFRPDNFIPFGTGRRLCLGDQMAMMQLFTSFSGLLQRYTIAPKVGVQVDLNWKILLSLLVPKTFQLDLISRSRPAHSTLGQTSDSNFQHSM
ncbi:Cytochrome P450 18a1 [Hypsibius exemplaris]|uniref:Cytochrome P450 18a1 n=1 Tax=Hypsibius exemplaris TaxID=2072580 RepID=A0A1W0WMW2_HYPEX|nr:Cytochrome P450 18a1 [Hypsibius exemplaris]